jgi:hypothetical protein
MGTKNSQITIEELNRAIINKEEISEISIKQQSS